MRQTVLAAALWPAAALLLAVGGGGRLAAAPLPPCNTLPNNVYCLLKPVDDTLPWCMTCVRAGEQACSVVRSGTVALLRRSSACFEAGL